MSLNGQTATYASSSALRGEAHTRLWEIHHTQPAAFTVI
jgi:hypothetical protein